MRTSIFRMGPNCGAPRGQTALRLALERSRGARPGNIGDELFQPMIFRLCNNCGHDFGDGKEEPRPIQRTLDDYNWRVPLLFAAILLAIGAVMLYFYKLFLPQ